MLPGKGAHSSLFVRKGAGPQFKGDSLKPWAEHKEGFVLIAFALKVEIIRNINLRLHQISCFRKVFQAGSGNFPLLSYFACVLILYEALRECSLYHLSGKSV